MSPHLFLLCMEYLSILLSIRTKNSDFHHRPKCFSNKLTHLAFADDLLIFAGGDSDSMKVVADSLEEFTLTSGLKINMNKSNIFMGGVRPFEQQQILDLFGFPMGTLPIKHLGLPLASRKLNIHYSPLVDQIAACINCWSNKYLSLAGRAELVRSVL